MGGRRSRGGGLRPEVAAGITLHAEVGRSAIALTRDPAGRAAAVARAALLAPGRPDVVDHVLDMVEGRLNPTYKRLGDWPPEAVMVDLLSAIRRVTCGRAALAGPGGVRIEQVPLVDPGPRPEQPTPAARLDGPAGRPVLRVFVNGDLVATARDVADLARHVPVDQLVLADDGPTEPAGENPPAAGGG